MVEREQAEAYVFARLRAVRDSWQAFPSRVAPMMAADLGLEDVRGVLRCLEKYVRAHLEEQADGESDDFPS